MPGSNPPTPQSITKEFWVPATLGTHTTPMTVAGDFPVAYSSVTGTSGHVSFLVPLDFLSIVSAILVVVAGQTASGQDVDINSDYGAIGQAYSAHSESDTASTYDWTNLQLEEIDVSGILTALAAGDYCGIKMTSNVAANAGPKLVGLRFKYN